MRYSFSVSTIKLNLINRQTFGVHINPNGIVGHESACSVFLEQTRHNVRYHELVGFVTFRPLPREPQ